MCCLFVDSSNNEHGLKFLCPADCASDEVDTDSKGKEGEKHCEGWSSEMSGCWVWVNLDPRTAQVANARRDDIIRTSIEEGGRRTRKSVELCELMACR